MDSLALRIAEHPHSAKFAPTNAAPPPPALLPEHILWSGLLVCSTYLAWTLTKCIALLNYLPPTNTSVIQVLIGLGKFDTLHSSGGA